MGLVTDANKAFRLCHGYKIDDELILWSEGVIGTLSDDQEYKCQTILIENASGGPRSFSSVRDAKRVKTSGIPEGYVKRMVAFRVCASLLDKAEDAGLIDTRKDVYGFMDYCMDQLGYDGVKKEYKLSEDVKEFIEKGLEKEAKSGVF
ncbi:hypothetical protein DRP07_00275 [Archaeoglobales archaeon]|nr:MAG: hypothetical protein DRP07_00275 [Archaeoglobales archaeon]